MSDPRDSARPGGDEADARAPAPEGRGTGSSLTDAVVAALANVSQYPPASSADPKASPSPGSAEGAGAAARPNGAAPVAAEPVAAEPVAAEPVAAEPAADVPAADVPAADVPAADVPAADVQPSGGPPAAEPSPEAPAAPASSAEASSAEASSAEASSAEASSAEPPSAEPSPATDTARDGRDARAPLPEEPTITEGETSEPTVKIGGAPVQNLTPESASETPEGIVVEYYGRTDVGLVREHNEDNFLVVDLSTERRGLGETPSILRTTAGPRGLVLAVCDGMGGAAAGEVASQMAVDTIHEIMQGGGPPRDRDQFARRLVRAVEEAGARIFSAAKMDRSRRGMGTTATVAGLVDSTLFVGQVGDSRAYVLRGDQFALITKDQSLVNQLIEAGQLTEEEAEAFEHSNIILQALGTTEEVTVDLTFLELRRGDRLLMCSDGLSGLVHADMMREVLRSSRDLSEAAQQLIAMANSGGGHDNITVICAEFDGLGLREATAEARVAYQQYPLPPADRDSAEPLPPRATAIKSGGPKPGADVKGDAAPSSASGEPGSSSRWWLFGVVALFVLVGIAAMILLAGGGEHGGADEGDADTTRVTIASTVSSRPETAPAAAAVGRIHVRTDVESGVLFVNGEPHPALRLRAAAEPSLGVGEEGAERELTLELPPGAYRLEIRDGDVRVADAVVTLEAGADETIDLSMPAGAMPDPGASDPSPAVASSGASDEGLGTAAREAAGRRGGAEPRRPRGEQGAGAVELGRGALRPAAAGEQASPGQVL